MNFGGMYFEIVDFKFVFETLTLRIFYLRLVIAIILFGDEEMLYIHSYEQWNVKEITCDARW